MTIIGGSFLNWSMMEVDMQEVQMKNFQVQIEIDQMIM